MAQDNISRLTKLRSISDISGSDETTDKTQYTLLDERIETKDPFNGENIRPMVWKVIDDYYRDPNRLTQHHLQSYDHFISYGIPKIIHDHNPLEVKANYNPSVGRYMTNYIIEFGDVYIGKPGIKENDGTTKMMYPIEARWRNLTYSADIFIDIHQKVIHYSDTGESTEKKYPTLQKVNLKSIPIMLKSKYCVLSSQTGQSMADLGECEFEKGGYFIVKGAEKVLVCQERKCENKILAFHRNKTQSAFSNSVEISSVPATQSFVRSTQMKLLKKTTHGTIQVFIQRFKSDSPFPLFIVFRALGVVSDKDIVEMILYDYKAPRNRDAFEMLKASLEEATAIQTQDMALLYMANHVSKMPEMKDTNESEERFRMNHVAELLKTELFPHVGESLLKKAWFLGMMAKKLIETTLGTRRFDDRDSFINKRINTSGALMADLFRNNFNKLVRDITKAVESDLRQGRIDEIHTSILKKIIASTLESSIRYALGTGTWGMKSQASSSKKGIAQPINRLSYASYISHLRRVNAPRSDKGGKVTEPRKLHSTQWMSFCLTGDTDVLLSDGTSKKIMDITERDIIMTVNPKTLEMEPSRIHSWFERDADRILKITTDSGRTIRCTPEHPFLIQKDGINFWVEARNLEVNQKLYEYEDQIKNTFIISIEDDEPTKVYDFTTVSNNHSFIANSIITHNCPSETPDGHMIGIVKNAGMFATITIGSDEAPIISILEEEKVTPILEATPKQMGQQVRVFIDGDPWGCTNKPDRLVAKLRQLRRSGTINIFTSISWMIEEQEILIHTKAGRICHPLFVVENNRLKITPEDFKKIARREKTWQDMILEGKIEYVDTQEEDTCMVAMFYEDLLANKPSEPTYVHYSHCEIHPAMMFGAVVCAIPFVENNQGPRVTFEAAQRKQALAGAYATNYRDRMDNPGQVLRFPQVPLVSTRQARYVHERDLPSGENAIVAIACFKGFNQEDSLIFNQSAIDRGLFSSMYYRTYKDQERKNQASLEEERFCKPVKFNANGTLRTAGTKSASYNLLDENGFVKVGSHVKGGDVIIGKVVPLKNTSEVGPKFKDASTSIADASSGTVDQVYVNRDSDGYQFAKVRIRSKRTPNIGDKLSSRFGQKGTIGQIYPQEDMPTTAEGLTPDLIVNPAAIPSRIIVIVLVAW